jgi:hypothetical protein
MKRLQQRSPAAMNRIFVSACALNLLLAAPCALTVERDPEQAKAVAEIEKLFGRVEIDEKRPDKPVITVHLGGTCLSNVVDDDLVHLMRLLGLKGTRVTDAGLLQIKGLSQLESLDLMSTQVTDAGLVQLYGLSKLRYLSLWGTKATAAGRKDIHRALPQCEMN